MTLKEAKQKLWATGSINTLSKVECDNLLNEVYDDFESESLRDNDLLSITYEAGRQAGKDSMKSEIAKAYMEGSESGRESMAKQND